MCCTPTASQRAESVRKMRSAWHACALTGRHRGIHRYRARHPQKMWQKEKDKEKEKLKQMGQEQEKEQEHEEEEK